MKAQIANPCRPRGGHAEQAARQFASKAGDGAAGQASIEALVAFAVLLSALALLVSQAQSSSAAAAGSLYASQERIRVSYAALSLDTAGSTLHAVQIPRPDGISASGWVVGGRHSSASEPVFHEVSTQGDMYVVGTDAEQV